MVAKTIHVDEEVYALIRRCAKSSGESANVALRRLLGLSIQPRPHSAAVTAVEGALRSATSHVTVYEVAEAVGVGRSTAASALAALEREGLASRIHGTMGPEGRTRDHWRPVAPLP